MQAGNDDASKDVARLLRRRPGWSLQALSTPGMPTVWCFGSGGDVDLSVMTDRASILVHVMEPDQDVRLDGVGELVTWLQAHKPESLRDQRSGAIDKLKAGRFFKWE